MKYIVIIGASSGMGRGVAETYARMGWRVGVAARRSEPLKQLALEWPEQMEYSAYDAAADDSADRLAELVERTGGMDILLFAAGCGWYNPEVDTNDDLRTISANVTGFTRTVNAAFHYYASRGSGGRIAAITSVAGVRGLGVSAAYSASKRYQWNYLQALEQLARSRRLNISFTDIRPGFVHTALLGRGPTSLPMTMDTEHAVRLIVKALSHGRNIVTIDRRWAIVSALWRLIPGTLWRRISPFRTDSAGHM